MIEHIKCPECKGEPNKIDGKLFSSCDHCKGIGYVDWVEVVTGVEECDYLRIHLNGYILYENKDYHVEDDGRIIFKDYLLDDGDILTIYTIYGYRKQIVRHIEGDKIKVYESEIDMNF